MKILSVSELKQEIKKQLEQQIGLISVQGEVSGLKLQSSGHFYFTLKDSNAQISAVLFQGSAKKLARLPKEGDQIIAVGEISIYAPKGSYQLLIRELRYQGVGELLLQLHERKNRLQARGLFAKERKKKLPSFPKTIGVITSPTGSVIQDILQILQRRHKGFHLILNPVKVQGDGAKEEIVKAIDECNQYALADVLILARGGGSLEDLAAFNEEVVVEAIARSNIPLISAVGHETDFSLSDFAADVRAPTPSAAAELVLTEKKQYLHFLEQSKENISQKICSYITHLKKQLAVRKKNPYLSSPNLLLSRKMQEVDDYKTKLSFIMQSQLNQIRMRLSLLEKQKNRLEPSNQIHLLRENLVSIKKSIDFSLQQTLSNKKKLFQKESRQKQLEIAFWHMFEIKKQNLQKLSSHLQAINPKNLLAKGYCILFAEKQNCVILSVKQVTPSQNIKILLQDGSIVTKVQGVVHD